MFAAKVTCQYQKPPHVRPAGHAVLLLRVRTTTATTEEPPRDTWRLPTTGEFEHPGEVEPWTDAADLVRLDASFDPPGVPAGNVQWMHIDLTAGCLPRNFEPGVLPALQRFVRDQTLDKILARADAATHRKGDDDMSTEIAALKRDLAALQRRVGPPLEGRDKFVAAQSRAEPIYRAFGDSAPPFVGSERLLDYRVRLLAPFQKRSAKFKAVDLSKVGDPVALSVLEDSIFEDSMAALHDPATYQPGEMRAIVTLDGGGRAITRYVGHAGACWDQFKPAIRQAGKFMTPGASR